MGEVVQLASRAGWPGYIGAPRFATAAQGARDHEAVMKLLNEYATRILDGFDHRSVERYSRDAGIPSYETEQAQRQEQWLSQHAAH